MNNLSIINREVTVEVLETGERRKLTIEIGYPVFIPEEDIHECITNYGWLLNEIPADIKPYFVRHVGVDAVDALMSALDMNGRHARINDIFTFILPNGDYLDRLNEKDHLYMRSKALEFSKEKRKDENYTTERHFYESTIRTFEEACKRYKKALLRLQ